MKEGQSEFQNTFKALAVMYLSMRMINMATWYVKEGESLDKALELLQMGVQAGFLDHTDKADAEGDVFFDTVEDFFDQAHEEALNQVPKLAQSIDSELERLFSITATKYESAIAQLNSAQLTKNLEEQLLLAPRLNSYALEVTFTNLLLEEKDNKEITTFLNFKKGVDDCLFKLIAIGRVGAFDAGYKIGKITATYAPYLDEVSGVENSLIKLVSSDITKGLIALHSITKYGNKKIAGGIASVLPLEMLNVASAGVIQGAIEGAFKEQNSTLASFYEATNYLSLSQSIALACLTTTCLTLNVVEDFTRAYQNNHRNIATTNTNLQNNASDYVEKKWHFGAEKMSDKFRLMHAINTDNKIVKGLVNSTYIAQSLLKSLQGVTSKVVYSMAKEVALVATDIISSRRK